MSLNPNPSIDLTHFLIEPSIDLNTDAVRRQKSCLDMWRLWLRMCSFFSLKLASVCHMGWVGFNIPTFIRPRLKVLQLLQHAFRSNRHCNQWPMVKRSWLRFFFKSIHIVNIMLILKHSVRQSSHCQRNDQQCNACHVLNCLTLMHTMM